MKITSTYFLLLLYTPFLLQAGAMEELIDQYQAKGAGPFTAEQGGVAWDRTVVHAKSSQIRRCSDCHGADLTKVGRHAKTGKRIEPMAPSVNPQRFKDPKKIEKWFKRNCKWTWGRVCTAQEKGDFLRYLQQY